MQTRSVVGHQLLYGYDDGHRLLAGSFKPETKVARALLALSDLSDSAQLGSCESYITGYPFLKEGFYALCKTWPAPEMKRPGCVWTHVLVFELHELARLDSPEAVLDAFSRPGRAELDSYSSTVQVPTPVTAYQHVSLSLAPYYGAILRELYGNPSEPLSVFTPENMPAELMAISIWLQQWPRLRRSFSFSTQAMDARSRAGFEFDFQLCPRPPLFRTRGVFLDSLLKDSNSDEPHWSSLLTHDLCQHDAKSPLRRFLRRHGAEVGRGRVAMRPLVASFVAVNSSDHFLAQFAIRASRQLRPRPVNLFKTLGRHVIEHQMVEGDVAEFLRINVDVIAGPETEEREQEVFAKLLRDSNDPRVWSLLSDDNECLQQIAAMAIEGASPEEAYTQLSEIPDTYLRVISKIPRFAATPLLWEASYARDAARLISPRSRSKRQILQAMYEARNPETATIAAETFGASSVSFCLELLNHGDYSSQTDRWLSAVSRTNQALLLRAIGRGRVHNIKALARVADCVPYDHNSTGLNRDEWASGIEHVGREPDVISLCVFLLTRALSGASPEPAKLLYFSFAPVHDSVRWSSFDADLWRQLAQSLPSVPGYKEWDRCYQVRLAVIEGFVKGTFPVSAFFQIAKTNNSFSQLVDTARGLHEGKNLLYSAAQLPPPSTRAERRQWRHVCDIVERNWFWDD